ncbi:uncharacterized protein [Heptranchias perlo]|uniref:uncharacterized protein n=1 Tax=Heptranchias perlo TaxID=212740 RepID=UPI00355A2B7F
MWPAPRPPGPRPRARSTASPGSRAPSACGRSRRSPRRPRCRGAARSWRWARSPTNPRWARWSGLSRGRCRGNGEVGPRGRLSPSPPRRGGPLAQSQPQLWSEGAAGTLPGPRYPLRRTPSANGSNHHAEERWGGPRSSVQGLRYLQQVCWLFDRIANLQECNAVLKQDRKDLEEQLRRHERQQELVRLCCSCGSAAFVLEAGPTRPRGRRGSPCQPHNPAAPCQRQPSGPAEPASIRLRKRWASDTSVSREAKGDMGLHHCKRDSFLLGNKDDLSDRSGGETCQPDSSRMTKDNRPQWDRVKSLVNRLKVKQGRGGSFVAKLKGTIQQNHS